MSGTDVKDLSDQILAGQAALSKLPVETRGQLINYWRGIGVDFSNPDVAQAQLGSLQGANFQQQAQQQAGSTFLGSAVGMAFKPVSLLGSLDHKLYSTVVSPALSFTALAAHSAIYGYDGTDSGFGEVKDLWNKAHVLSPGQAVWELGMDNASLNKAGISPNQIAWDKSLVAKGQYHDTPSINDPWGNMPRYQEYFNSGWAQNVSGGTDLAASWFLDPLSKIGKAGEIAKTAKVTRPVAKLAKQAGKTGQAITDLTPVAQVSDRIMQIKQASTPGTAAYNLRTQIGTLRRSTAGDALATLLAGAKDQDEVNRVLRISMGDTSALGATLARRDELAANVAGARQNVTAIDGRVKQLEAQGIPANSPAMANVVRQQQQYKDILETHIADQAMVEHQLQAANSVENLNYNKVTNTIGNYIASPTRWYNGSYGRLGDSKVQAIGTALTNTGIFAARLIRSYSDIKPSHYIDVHADDSWREVDAALQEAKSMSQTQRQQYVSSYMAANANQRQTMLLGIEQGAVKNMVDRYNAGKPEAEQISTDMARKIFQDYDSRRSGAINSVLANRQTFGTSTLTQDGVTVPTSMATNQKVFDFSDTGEALLPSPIFETQIANTHIMMDFGAMEKAIRQYGSRFSRAREAAGLIKDNAAYVFDNLNHYWKAAQLMRLGYGPRALSDDFFSQVARFGAMAMVQRAAEGGKITLQDFFRTRFKKDETELARANMGVAQQQIDELTGEQTRLANELTQHQPGTYSYNQVKSQLDTTSDSLEQAKNRHYNYSQVAAAGVGTRGVRVGRDVYSAPYGGAGGQMARDDIAGTRAFETVMEGPTNYHLRRMRQMGWQDIKADKDNAQNHLAAWFRVVNQQIAKSYPGRLALQGYGEGQIAHMLRTTPEGQQFVRDMGLVHTNELELAQRVKAEVDHQLNPAIPGMDAVRQAALNNTLTPKMLEDAIPNVNARPAVNAEMWDYATGKHQIRQWIDNGISAFYKAMADTPSRVLLRNPLFKQEYKASLVRQINARTSQGITHVSEIERSIMENQARRQAMQEVKRNTFSMTHESKMAYHLRFLGAFFGATQESWNRWARIIGDRPQTLPQIAYAYNAPSRAGLTYDQNGNKVGADGYATDPDTGQRYFVPVGQRNMVLQVPDFLADGFLGKATGFQKGDQLSLPLSSWQTVLTEGDGPLPVGAGPIVTFPANYFAQHDPGFADFAQKSGLLPYGPQGTWDPILASYMKKGMQANDTNSTAYQRALGYLMQSETQKYDQGIRKDKPTWSELDNKAKAWMRAKTIFAYTSPFTINKQDPYQFFRDEYNRMQSLDPSNADEKFLEKYGDSFYDFTMSMSKNNSGLKATSKAVQLSKQWQDLIANAGTQYAGLIVGDEQNTGTYSQGAYYYEQNTVGSPADGQTLRSNVSAQEAWNNSQVNLGWQQYNQIMNQLNAQLIQRGLTSYSDKGAADLSEIRKNAVNMMTQKYMTRSFTDPKTGVQYNPGDANPYYNAAFANAYGQLNTDKYNKNAEDLSKIVADKNMWAKAYDPATNKVGQRSDIYTLAAYLDYRSAMQKALAIRKGSGGSDDINANSNADLRAQFEQKVNGLIEADTKFLAIHSRYFANDMGYTNDTNPVVLQTLAAQQQGQMTSLAGQEAPLQIGEAGSLG